LSLLLPHPTRRARLCGSAGQQPLQPPTLISSPQLLRASVPQPLGFSPLLPHPTGRACLSVAVPVSNGATFAFNAAAGYAFGEKIQPALALGGVSLAVLGIALCV
ncbi:unnamed protein product, partial [Closterium sp. Naga37s-1]